VPREEPGRCVRHRPEGQGAGDALQPVRKHLQRDQHAAQQEHELLIQEPRRFRVAQPERHPCERVLRGEVAPESQDPRRDRQAGRSPTGWTPHLEPRERPAGHDRADETRSDLAEAGGQPQPCDRDRTQHLGGDIAGADVRPYALDHPWVDRDHASLGPHEVPDDRVVVVTDNGPTARGGRCLPQRDEDAQDHEIEEQPDRQGAACSQRASHRVRSRDEIGPHGFSV
jgi:hypothetical protein